MTNIENIKPIIFVSAVALITIAINLCLYQFKGFPLSDSGGYFSAGEELSAFRLDYLRTPVYPIICKVALTLCGDKALTAISLFQHFVHFLSILAFFKAIANLTKNDEISMLAALFYAFNPVIMSWCPHILSESLALSLTTIFLWLTSELLSKPSRTGIAYSIPLFLLLLLMLRPFFICFSPILIVLAFYLYRASKRTLPAFLIATAICVGSFIGYSYAYKAQFGSFGTSAVSAINKSEQLKEIGVSTPFTEVQWSYPYTIDGTPIQEWRCGVTAEGCATVDSLYKEHIPEIAACSLKHFVEQLSNIYPERLKSRTSILQLSFSTYKLITLLVYALLFMMLTTCRTQRTVRHLATNVILLGMFLGPIVTSFAGANDEYNRLVLPMLPAFFAIIAILLNHIKNHLCR